MSQHLSDFELEQASVRASDKTFRRRKFFDPYFAWIRSCAVCRASLGPIDFLCSECWCEFDRIVNRDVKQKDFVFETSSLLTWTVANDAFVRRFAYGFKRGFAVGAAERLALLLASSVKPSKQPTIVVPAPSRSFDHSSLWAEVLARQLGVPLLPALKDPAHERKASGDQKALRQGDRGSRRYEIREHFAKSVEEARGAKRIIFADDVITSGSTAMAAYMALGDPDQFEVWTLAARPRLAAKTRVC